MDGIIIVNKPRDWTSFDVVAKIRNLSRTKKVGHSGTLDPMATGVLPVFLGKATKSIPNFVNGDKGYEGEITFGVMTDTGDAEGKVINSQPETLNNIAFPKVQEVMNRYLGEIEQVPPMYSAIKINGQRLYDLARQGIEVKREPRKIKIYDLRITSDETRFATDKRITFSVTCSKGTYIRQLAVDIGDELGCGAHLSKLVRTYAQPFRLSQAISMETIVTLAGVGKLESVLIPVESILTS